MTDNGTPRLKSLVVVIGATTPAPVVGAQCFLADTEPRFRCLSGRGGSTCTAMLLVSTTVVCTPRCLYSFLLLLPFTSELAVITEPRLERLFADSPSLSSSHLVAEGTVGPSSSSSSALSSSSPSRLLISVLSSHVFLRPLRYTSSSKAGANTGGGTAGCKGLTSLEA